LKSIRGKNAKGNIHATYNVYPRDDVKSDKMPSENCKSYCLLIQTIIRRIYKRR